MALRKGRQPWGLKVCRGQMASQQDCLKYVRNICSNNVLPGVLSEDDKSAKNEKSKSGEEEEQHSIAPSMLLLILPIFVFLKFVKTLSNFSRCFHRSSSSSWVCVGRWRPLERGFLVKMVTWWWQCWHVLWWPQHKDLHTLSRSLCSSQFWEDTKMKTNIAWQKHVNHQSCLFFTLAAPKLITPQRHRGTRVHNFKLAT